MDAELRELSRLARAGDAGARGRLVGALVRARRSDPAAWTGTGLEVQADLFRVVEQLPPDQVERLTGDLVALDPLRLGAHWPRGQDGRPGERVRLAGYTVPGPRWSETRALLARRAPEGVLALQLETGWATEAPRWSWDGRLAPAVTRLDASSGRVLLARADGELLALQAGAPRALARGPAPILALRGAADGRLAWVVPDAVHVREPGGAERARPLPLRAHAAALSPDLAAVAVSDGQALALLELADGRPRWRLKDARLPDRAEVQAICDLAFSSDGARLAQAGGAVVVRQARDGGVEGTPVLPGRATRHWSDNQSTMGLGRDEGVHESWPDAQAVRWLDTSRLATLGGGQLRTWTLGPHARPGRAEWHYGEDTSSREEPHQTCDARARADALLDCAPQGRLLVLVEGTPRLLGASQLAAVWTGAGGGSPIVAGVGLADRVVLTRADGALEELPL